MNISHLDLGNIDFIDLTHSLHHDIPTWDIQCGFQCSIDVDYNASSELTKFRVQHLDMPAGIGTHIDAPSHCILGSRDVSEINLQELICPCIKIDVSQKAHSSYLVNTNDIIEFEQQYGKIPANSLVIIHTGWSHYWKQPDRYHNNLLFPSISKEVAILLLDRNINGIGIDTLSPDSGDSDFPVHRLILGANKYIIENIANSDKLPETGTYAIALPTKIKGCTEASTRLIAIKIKDP